MLAVEVKVVTEEMVWVVEEEEGEIEVKELMV